ncbi:hypothetical protein HZA57_05460, partial [Candidatus Poribacteria bacterium]|nr:hypothetical protein [Candidatus Poribacteria bacterium]
LMVYAFKDGEIVAALLILCCTFGKIWYVFSKYEGPAPGVFKILVTLEFLSIVLFRFADVMLLAR